MATLVESFPFEFETSYRYIARPFGVTPRNAVVTIAHGQLNADFGPWHVHTPLSNIVGAEITGPYLLVKTAGPARLTFSDRGLTFATNGRRGAFLSFREPIPGIEPFRLVRHPNLTVTVADCAGLIAAVG